MENNFEKNLQRALNDSPDFPFNEEAWKDIKSQLDEKPIERKKSRFAGFLPILLWSILPITLGGLFFLSYTSLLEKNAALESLLENKKTTILIDTIYEKNVTIIYDTIYQTVVIQKTQIGDTPMQINTDFSEITDFHLPPPYPNFSNQNASIFERANENVTSPVVLEEESINTQDEIFDNKETLPFLPLLESDSLTTEQYNLKLPSVLSKKKRRRKTTDYYLMKMTPNRFEIAASGGSFFTFNSLTETNWSASLQSDIGYGEKISLVVGAEILRHRVEINANNNMNNLPEPPPDNMAGRIKEIYGNFNFLQLPVGLKYSLFPQKRLRPYLAGGLISRTALSSKLKYEMVASNEEYYLSTPNLLPQTFGIKAYWGTIGMQFDIAKQWRLKVEGSSQIDLNSGTYFYQNLKILKLNAGIQYQL